MQVTVILSFLCVLGLFTASGALAWLKKRETPEDYLVASRKVSPWLSALSAVSTNNSGFMFIAMIGFTYRNGLEAFWLVVGWILGDLTIWLFIHPKTRKLSGDLKVNTLPTLLAKGHSKADRALVAVAGLVVLIFLGTYAAAQLKAGGTAINALFQWDMAVGTLIGTAIVVLYSFAGGIRADIWTDATQSFVMLATMILLLAVSAVEIGGLEPLYANLQAQDPRLVQWFPTDLQFGLGAYLLSLFFNGLGIAGQPHVLVRLFSVESVEKIARTGLWYFGWYIPFALASLAVGLYARAIIPDIASLSLAQNMAEPTELALPLITMRLLPEIFVGVSLAGLFAATISTADSQVIVCSGAITHDMAPRFKNSYLASKVGSLIVAALATGIAIFAPEGVFNLVLIAWSVMGAGLGSVLALRLFGLPFSPWTAIAMMAVAILTVSYWHFWLGDQNKIYEMLPATVAAFAVYGAVRGWGLIRQKRGPNQSAP